MLSNITQNKFIYLSHTLQVGQISFGQNIVYTISNQNYLVYLNLDNIKIYCNPRPSSKKDVELNGKFNLNTFLNIKNGKILQSSEEKFQNKCNNILNLKSFI